MTLVAVADAGPIIHLAEIDALELLSLADTLYVPERVYDELEAGSVPNGLAAVEHTTVSAEPDSIDAGDLDPGETAALAVALERDAVLLTDDLAAREHASEVGIEVHGSIGVIALGYARDALDRDEAVSMMRSLQHATSLFVSDAVVERGIELLEDD